MANEVVSSSSPVHKSAQRFRWFVREFEKQIDRTQHETGNAFELKNDLLGKVFTEWLVEFENQKPKDEIDNPDYVGFASGLMLKHLIRTNPIIHVSKAAHVNNDHPAYFWPEGYLYVAFCLNVRGLVLQTDYGESLSECTLISDVRTWWSFKENTNEDDSLAIGFLDLFAGENPDWNMPGLFRSKKIRDIAHRFYEPKALEHE